MLVIFFSAATAGIEALQVADLQDAFMLGRGVHQAPRGGQIGSDGLFHQHVDTGFEQLAAHFGVERSWHRHHRRVDVALEFTERREGQAIVLGRSLGRTLRIGIHHAHQRGIQRLAQHAQVMPSEYTRANDGDSNFVQNLTYHGNIEVSHGDNLSKPSAIEGFCAKG